MSFMNWIELSICFISCFVKISLTAKEGDIRLNGGAVNSIGRVEIFHADQWGAICHGDTLRKEDTVACRQLGFLSSRSYPYNISYYLPTLPVLLKIEECTGKEENVTECATGFVEDRPFCEGPYCCTFFLKVHCDPRPRVQSKYEDFWRPSNVLVETLSC